MEPLLGTGLGTYGYWAKPMGSFNDIPDNMYMLVLAETGFVGFIVWISLLLLVLLVVWKQRLKDTDSLCILPAMKPDFKHDTGDMTEPFCRKSPRIEGDLKVAFLACFTAFMVNMLTWDAMAFPVTRIVFWILCGLGVAFARSQPSGEFNLANQLEAR